MDELPHHRWNLNPTQAIVVQRNLRHQVTLQPFPDEPTLIAGADISFNKYSPVVYAGFVLLRYPSLEIVDSVGCSMEVSFPYISGLLSFREIPPLLKAWEQMSTKPDLVVLDGQGIAHPRRLGIASHFGILANIPTIGCAKSRLVGDYVEPNTTAGSSSPLTHRGERVGTVLRTKDKVQPVFVSPGHLVDQESAVRILLNCRRGYRIPEPTRLAHLFVNELRLEAMRRISA